MDATEFLEFSKKLDTSHEAYARSCISRAYYCAYHETKEFLENELNIDIARIEGGSHEKISKALIMDKNLKIKGLGYKMVTFHARRVMADYKLNEECQQSKANEAINECEKILEIIREYKT